MITDNPELRAKILDWQKRYNIQDGDPAIALLELVQFLSGTGGTTYVRSEPSGEGGASAPVSNVTANVSGEALPEAMKTALLPVIARVLTDTQPLKPPLAVRLLARYSFFRRIPARIIGLGIRPEHVSAELLRAGVAAHRR